MQTVGQPSRMLRMHRDGRPAAAKACAGRPLSARARSRDRPAPAPGPRAPCRCPTRRSGTCPERRRRPPLERVRRPLPLSWLLDAARRTALRPGRWRRTPRCPRLRRRSLEDRAAGQARGIPRPAAATCLSWSTMQGPCRGSESKTSHPLALVSPARRLGRPLCVTPGGDLLREHALRRNLLPGRQLD